ncbi:MAG: helix-turn-helix domain-containing protein [Kiritimatiellae bacterium]|nr:helix-turn-helix domain-containing protein [Kiritimatiellia bacterium]
MLLSVSSVSISGPFAENWGKHPEGEIEIFHVLGGRGTMTVESDAYRLAPGKTLLVLSRQAHATRLGARETMSGIDIHLKAGACYPELARIDVKKVLSAPPSVSKRVARLMREMAAEAKSLRVGAQNMADALLAQLLVELVRCAGGTTPASPAESAATNQNVKRICDACRDHIRANFRKPLSLAEVASAIAVSPFYLSHVFSRHTGSTFIEHVNEVRLQQARSLLVGTDLTVSEIADRVGYSDVYYFSKVFKKTYACPPTQFRKRYAS